MDVDGSLVSVGEFGSYQKRLTVIFVLLQIYVACQSMLIVLVGAQPDYKIISQEVPSTHEDLVKYVVFEEDFTSIVTEWYLIRQEAYKVNLAGSLFFLGLLFGNILFGPLSDQFGRKPIFLIGLFLDVVFGFISAAAPNYEIFALMRLLVGFVNGGMSLVAFVLTQEFVGKSYWALTGSLTNLVFAFGIAAFAVIGYFIRDWRVLTAAANCPGVLFFFFFITIPESPRWLYSQGRTEEAEEVLQSIAYRNGNEKIFIQLKPCAGANKVGQSAHGLMELVRHPVLRWRSVILMYVWQPSDCLQLNQSWCHQQAYVPDHRHGCPNRLHIWQKNKSPITNPFGIPLVTNFKSEIQSFFVCYHQANFCFVKHLLHSRRLNFLIRLLCETLPKFMYTASVFSEPFAFPILSCSSPLHFRIHLTI
ncbi:solute carrier family 22 member 15 isoform X3 [Mobula birostris]|uniref:solute carrier family 22 member 15 isoform X3 n=1 Tax=Mobula birostris TaxID=1983395 RepID=UPI003B28A6F4